MKGVFNKLLCPDELMKDCAAFLNTGYPPFAFTLRCVANGQHTP